MLRWIGSSKHGASRQDEKHHSVSMSEGIGAGKTKEGEEKYEQWWKWYPQYKEKNKAEEGDCPYPETLLLLQGEASSHDARQGECSQPFKAGPSDIRCIARTLQQLAQWLFNVSVLKLYLVLLWVCLWLHMYILWSIHECVHDCTCRLCGVFVCAYDCTCMFCGAYVNVFMTAHAHSVEHTWVCVWLPM